MEGREREESALSFVSLSLSLSLSLSSLDYGLLELFSVLEFGFFSTSFQSEIKVYSEDRNMCMLLQKDDDAVFVSPSLCVCFPLSPPLFEEIDLRRSTKRGGNNGPGLDRKQTPPQKKERKKERKKRKGRAEEYMIAKAASLPLRWQAQPKCERLQRCSVQAAAQV